MFLFSTRMHVLSRRFPVLQATCPAFTRRNCSLLDPPRFCSSSNETTPPHSTNPTAPWPAPFSRGKLRASRTSVGAQTAAMPAAHASCSYLSTLTSTPHSNVCPHCQNRPTHTAHRPNRIILIRHGESLVCIRTSTYVMLGRQENGST